MHSRIEYNNNRTNNSNYKGKENNNKKDKTTNRRNNKSNNKNGKAKCDNTSLILWNCNGLKEDKFIDIQDLYFSGKNNNTIVCLTETHHKGKILNLKDDIKGIGTFRPIEKRGKKKKEEKNSEDKKGGGLQVLYPNSEKIELKKVKNKSTEILDVEGKVHGLDIKIIVAYFDVDKGETGRKNNTKIRKEIEKIIENNDKEGLIIAGDFNRHLRMIDGRSNDENGYQIMD